MPVYEAVCPDCEIAADYLRSVENCMDTPDCISCGNPMKKVIFSAPKGFVKGKFEPFKSHVDGTIISTEREMKEHNLRNNVVNVADGWSDEVVKRGDYIAPPKNDLGDIKSDIAEATAMVTNGYKPNTEVYDE